VDGAGNVEPHQVVVEGAGPVITVTRTPLPNEAGWNSSDVTLSFDCVDNESGVALCPAPVTVSTEGAHQTVTVTAWDNAGNPNTATVSDINIDLTAPTVTFSGNVGAYTVDQSVVINCAAADALSGLQSTTCANLNTPAYMLPLGINTVNAEATDRVGHLTAASTTFTVNVTYDAMCNLTQRFATSKNVANNLCKLLRNAASAEAKGDLAKKQQNIQLYIDGVNAQVGKAFTTDQAAVLTRLAQAR
jgi:hypothetical protein